MSDSLLGLQLYTVRDDLTADLAATAKKVAELGIKNVEPHRAHADPQGYFDALTAAGLKAPSMHTRFVGEPLETQEEYFRAARKLGCSVIIHPATDADLWHNKNRVEEFAQSLNGSAKLAASYGVHVGYHHHAYELQATLEGVPALVYFARLLNPQVALQIDVYWAAVAGIDPAELITQLQPAVQLLHLKDAVVDLASLEGASEQERINYRPAQSPLGQGNIDIKAAIAAAPQAQRIVEFDSFDGNLWQAIAQSVEYLREVQ